MPITSHVVLTEGQADWSRLQSLFGLVRALGGSVQLAWIVQATGSIAVAAAIVYVWRSRAAFDLKAAALAAGTLVVTPYLYMYDLVVLAVAVAFLLRFALDRGFTTSDIVGLGVAGALILSYPYVKTQVGLAAVLIVLALIAQRAFLASACYSAGTIAGTIGLGSAKLIGRCAMTWPTRRAATIASTAIAAPAPTSMK